MTTDNTLFGSNTADTQATDTNKSNTTESAPKAVDVTSKANSPIDVTPTTDKAKTQTGGGETKMAKDPKDMFDYSNCQTHVVADGESLYDIAQNYKVALQQLRYFNHIDKLTFKIRVGQTIYIPDKPIPVPAGK